MYSSYAGKSRTNSNLAWHRPQTAIARVEEELMQKSARALDNTTDPLEKLRLLCLTRGAAGIMALGRIFRKMYGDGKQELNEEEFVTGIKDTGLDISNETTVDTSVSMKLSNRFAYMSGEDTGDLTMDTFLANFEVGGTIDGKVTLEEFMNYYSGISVSIDNDGFFDLMMRQAYKL